MMIARERIVEVTVVILAVGFGLGLLAAQQTTPEDLLAQVRDRLGVAQQAASDAAKQAAAAATSADSANVAIAETQTLIDELEGLLNPPPPPPPPTLGEWHPQEVDGVNTLHEHGDAPWPWARTTVIGDLGVFLSQTESHNGFKGVRFQGGQAHEAGSNQGNLPDCGQGYHMVHLIETPKATHGITFDPPRGPRSHSFKAGYRDCSGGITVMQGMQDFGTLRFQRYTGHTDVPGSVRPVVFFQGLTSDIVGNQWYAGSNTSVDADLQPQPIDIHHLVIDPPFFVEQGDPDDPSTWVENPGKFGTHRRMEFFLIAQIIRQLPMDQLYCATAVGHKVVAQNADGSCPEGALPQYIASTIFKDMTVEYTVLRLRADRQAEFSTGLEIRRPN